MAEKTNTAAFLKVDCKYGVQSPPWGDHPPARPLSPKRRRPQANVAQATVNVTKPAQTRLPSSTLSFGICFATAIITCSWYLCGDSSVTETLASDMESNSSLFEIQEVEPTTQDVFILSKADFAEPHQLENYSVGSRMQEKEVFVHRDRGSQTRPLGPGLWESDFLQETRAVFMNKLKLEEVGTVWSQAQLPSASSPEVTFRKEPAEIGSEQDERPSSHLLQWWVEERPFTYKLQWFASMEELAEQASVQMRDSNLPIWVWYF